MTRVKCLRDNDARIALGMEAYRIARAYKLVHVDRDVLLLRRLRRRRHHERGEGTVGLRALQICRRIVKAIVRHFESKGARCYVKVDDLPVLAVI